MNVWDDPKDDAKKWWERHDAVWVFIGFMAATTAFGLFAAICGDYYYRVLATVTSGGFIIQAWAQLIALGQSCTIAACIISRIYTGKWWWSD